MVRPTHPRGLFRARASLIIVFYVVSSTASMKKLYLVTTRICKMVHPVRHGRSAFCECRKANLFDAEKPEKDEEVS